MKPTKDKRGYLKVDLRHGEYRKTMFVHRLVALAFIENPNAESLKEVNHKDENKENNCVDNLEWCDTKYNCNYGTRNQRRVEKCKKKVCSVDKDGKITYYNSRNEAAETLGIDATSISKALQKNNDNNKTAGGMLWYYYDENIENIIKENNILPTQTKTPVYSIDELGNVQHYSSISEAHNQTGIKNISRALKYKKTAGNRKWFYEAS